MAWVGKILARINKHREQHENIAETHYLLTLLTLIYILYT